MEASVEGSKALGLGDVCKSANEEGWEDTVVEDTGVDDTGVEDTGVEDTGTASELEEVSPSSIEIGGTCPRRIKGSF